MSKTIEEIKEQMQNFKDFYGGDFLDLALISECKSKKELAKIIEDHEAHMEMMLCDAISHLSEFKKCLGLTYSTL